MNHNNNKWTCVLVFVRVKCLYRVIMMFYRIFQEVGHKFFSEIFRKLNVKIYAGHFWRRHEFTLDGVMYKILEILLVLFIPES